MYTYGKCIFFQIHNEQKVRVWPSPLAPLRKRSARGEAKGRRNWAGAREDTNVRLIYGVTEEM